MSETKLIHKKIIEVMALVGAISKDRKNDQQGYKFRGIEDVYNEFHPHFGKSGLFSVPRVISKEQEIFQNKNGTRMTEVILGVEFDFTAEDGSFVTVGPIYSQGLDSGDKAYNKAMSAAHKYAFIQLFVIPTEDERDADYSSPTVPRDAQKVAKPKAAVPAIKPAVPSQGPAPEPLASDAEKAKASSLKKLVKLAKDRLWSNAQVSEFINLAYGKAGTADMTDAELNELAATIEGFAAFDAIKLARATRDVTPEAGK